MVTETALGALKEELIRLRQENRRLHSENDRLHGENDRLHAENDRLHGENDRLHGALRREASNASLPYYHSHEMTAGTCVGPKRSRT